MSKVIRLQCDICKSERVARVMYQFFLYNRIASVETCKGCGHDCKCEDCDAVERHVCKDCQGHFQKAVDLLHIRHDLFKQKNPDRLSPDQFLGRYLFNP